MDRKSELLVRVYIVFFVFVLFATVIMSKVITISLFEGEKWREKGGTNVKWIEVNGERGNIYDCRGNLLATSLPYFDIYIDVMTISDALYAEEVNELCLRLSTYLGNPPEYWQAKFSKARSEKNRYMSLVKHINKEELHVLRSFPIFREGRYKGGFMYEYKSSREKPYKQLASRTIGLDRKNASRIGLEKSYNQLLEGEKQRRLMQRYPGDQWLPIFDPSDTEQKRGSDVVTTLDMTYQDIVHHELEATLKKYNAEAGTAILMEVETGAIKAISNLGKRDEGRYTENYNYAVGRLSEPGSTFKLISAMALLETGKIELDTKIAVNGGKKKFYDRMMYDSERHGKSVVSFKEAFEISSNVGLANSAFAVFGKSRSSWLEFYESLKKLGVMNSTGIGITGEPDPFFKNPAPGNKDKKSNAWSGTTVPWMAHGYELEMTPLQILSFYNAVANDGVMMKPYLVSEILTPDQKPKEIKPVILNAELASEKTIRDAQEMLRGVAERGTAKKFEITNTSFAGKTGTTRINYWKQTDEKEYNASFAGYFPADNPKYSLMVVIYNPKGAYYGSQVAGPVFSEIVQRVSGMEQRVIPEYVEGRKFVAAHSGYKTDYKDLLEYIGIEYSNHTRSNWVEMNDDNSDVELKSKKIKVKEVPDVRGMGLRDAVYVLESLGLQVEVQGMGRVYKQSLRTGTKIKGQTITIYLR